MGNNTGFGRLHHIKGGKRMKKKLKQLLALVLTLAVVMGFALLPPRPILAPESRSKRSAMTP